ncbi:MAG: SiaB family protein kinase [Bacteroidia bacterium]|nr:SiaB family protein kinase [Bacteroidia bacterium]
MDDEFVLEILRVMETNNVILAFNGEFDMRVINALVTSVKEKLSNVESNIFVQKKIYNVMVECLENIFRHSENAIQQHIHLRSFAIFTLRKDGNDYYLVTGNYVQNKSVDFLKNIIDKINTLNKAQRWEMYREILANGEFSDKGGAGLGIIDIAIKSGSQLKYDFRKLNDNNTFYVFQVCIHNNNSHLNN